MSGALGFLRFGDLPVAPSTFIFETIDMEAIAGVCCWRGCPLPGRLRALWDATLGKGSIGIADR